MPRRRIARALLPVVLVLASLASCDGATEPESRPPDGSKLVAASVRDLADVHSVRFNLTVNGRIPGFPIRSANGVASTRGWARGTVDVQQGLEHTEYRFTLRHGSVVLADGEGTPSRRPAPANYTPDALLSSEKGLGRLLQKSTALRTETTETLHGVETYRVTGKLGKDALAELVPGVWADATVKFWVSKAPNHRLRRVWIQLPPRRPNVGVVAIQLALSKPTEPSRPTTPTPPSTSATPG